MTDRIPLDHLTSDALDALYEQLEAAEQTESQRQLATAREAFASATTRAARAEAAIERVRALAARIRWGAPWTANHDDLANRILAALDKPGPAEAATEATQPHTGLVIEPYRNDRGQHVWVFRCWGTDNCDGWLSLDHSSQESAERARDRHVREEHPAEPAPAALREQLRAAIESAVYGYRELTTLWPETGGYTEEIARRATDAAVRALEPADGTATHATEPCPEFPDRCPNLIDIPARSPYHGGGIRCGCSDQPKEQR